MLRHFLVCAGIPSVELVSAAVTTGSYKKCRRQRPSDLARSVSGLARRKPGQARYGDLEGTDPE